VGVMDDAGTGGDLLELQATQSFVAESAKTGARLNHIAGLLQEAPTPDSLPFQNCSSKSLTTTSTTSCHRVPSVIQPNEAASEHDPHYRDT
jgi:hypothetical protein